MSGRVITFYSWKGGVGRTMAMANVGVQLARRGKRVLLVDWDLEAPGLDRYFQGPEEANVSQFSTEAPSDITGLLGLLSDAVADMAQDLPPDAWRRRCGQIALPPLQRLAHKASTASSPQPLHLLGSGLRSAEYGTRLQAFSWESFFADMNGGQWIEDLREQWRETYDFILIDSRTGLTDSGGICTVQMPDALVFVFTANTQSLEDGLAFMSGVHKARAAFAFERAPLTVVPLLARWEGDREVDLADSWIERIVSLVGPLVETWLPRDLPVRRMLERLRVPHVARFSFGEPLPVLTHSLTDPDRPGLAYELLSELFASGFSNAGAVIEPGYQPVLDPVHSTNAEIDELVLDDKALEVAMSQVAKTAGAESVAMVLFNLRLAEGCLRVGTTTLADELARSAASTARRLANVPLDSSVAQLVLSLALTLQGDIRQTRGNIGDALLAYHEALATRRRLVETDPSNTDWQADLSVSQGKLGDVLSKQGNLTGALAAYRESLAVIRRLAETDPSNADWQADLSVSQGKLGDVLRKQGDLTGALAAYRESLAVSRRLAETDPSNADWQRELSVSQDKLGDVLRKQGDLTGALAAYRETLAVSRRLAESDPSNVDWQADLSVSQGKLGDVLSKQGDLTGALAAYRETLAISRRLAMEDESNVGWQRDLSFSLTVLAQFHEYTGAPLAGLPPAEESLTIDERLAALEPSNVTWQRDVAVSRALVARLRGDGPRAKLIVDSVNKATLIKSLEWTSHL